MPATLTLEHYEVLTREDGTLHELGRGAMGITYKGIDTRLRVPVALKVINAAHLHSESARQRFVREARAAAQLRHRNVASVFHLGEEGGNYFYAMEFIDGETVEALVKRHGTLPPGLALRITAQVARALNAAQMQDLVHRDIKPANLMAVLEDDDLVIKVIDFGLAKIMFGSGEADAASLTQGGFLGTPHFASPEQLEEREIDVRSDIYSLGVTLWFLLCGNTPFSGSVARVVSQHLSKPPPFEELASVPTPVVELLRKMLAKDPAERPQSPVELRKEIEQCLQSLVEAGGPAPMRRGSSSPASATGQLTVVPDDLRFETGVTIAQRYLITQDLGENEAGTSFRGRDLQQDRDVRLLMLHRELLADSDAFAQVEREASTITALVHPHVLEVFGLTTFGRATFLTLGWTNGFTLRELLRNRRELPPAEVRRLLEPAAVGLDHAVRQLPRLELGLHHVLIHFPGRERPEDLLSQAVSEWPDFVVKINPLATWRELFAQTWAAGQTLVGGAGQHARKSAAGLAGAVQAFAAIAYELLGGVAAPGSSACDYTPLAALDEAGNDVLHRALFTPESFPSVGEFMRQFAAPPAMKLAPAWREKPLPVTLPQPAEPVMETTSTTAHPTRALSPEDAPPGQPRRAILVPLAILFTAIAIGFAIYHTRSRTKPPLLTQTTPPPRLQPQTPAPTPLLSVRIPTPVPLPSIRPTTPSPSTLPPPPTRHELASDARRAAETLEARQQNREALSAWLRMAREFPEFDTGRLGLELLLTRLRHRPGGFSPAEFAAMQPQIRAAAQLGVLAAMMTLGEELRETDPKQAFAWYCTAAEGGDPLAMMQAGLMLSNGAGTPRDLRKAVAYFQAGADKNEPAAMAVLAECYLDGEGVAEDPKQALVLLQKAADQGNARAKNRLGLCYHKGIGVVRQDREAFRLFSEAAERGSVEAISNLGTLYMKGEGVEKSATKAAEKFKEASLKGDLNGMYYYAGCLDGGFGVKTNANGAKTWFQKAAAAGHPGAIEWCKSKNLPVKPPR